MVHEVRSQQYERNAEPLPHVQHHTVFKGFLAGFYKLHKEAEGEYGSEAVAEIETAFEILNINRREQILFTTKSHVFTYI